MIDPKLKKAFLQIEDPKELKKILDSLSDEEKDKEMLEHLTEMEIEQQRMQSNPYSLKRIKKWMDEGKWKG